MREIYLRRTKNTELRFRIAELHLAIDHKTDYNVNVTIFDVTTNARRFTRHSRWQFARKIHFRRVKIAKNTRSNRSNPTCRVASRSITPCIELCLRFSKRRCPRYSGPITALGSSQRVNHRWIVRYAGDSRNVDAASQSQWFASFLKLMLQKTCAK